MERIMRDKRKKAAGAAAKSAPRAEFVHGEGCDWDRLTPKVDE
jgi:hypothetical protein